MRLIGSRANLIFSLGFVAWHVSERDFDSDKINLWTDNQFVSMSEMIFSLLSLTLTVPKDFVKWKSSHTRSLNETEHLLKIFRFARCRKPRSFAKPREVARDCNLHSRLSSEESVRCGWILKGLTVPIESLDFKEFIRIPHFIEFSPSHPLWSLY